MVDWNLNVNLNSILDVEPEFKRIFSETHESLNTNEYFFEHELNELNEFFIKTCDSKIIRVIRIIRVQKKLRYVVYIFEHELNELNEFFIKTCDSKIIRVIRIIRAQKNISGLYMLGVVL